MRPIFLVLLALVFGISGSNIIFAQVLGRSPEVTKPEFYDPLEVLELYYKAVKRGELVVHDRKINESMLIPVHVKYVYEIDSTALKINVYSKLKEPKSVPGLENCSFHGVSAVIDASGRIVETEVHILSE